MVLNIQRKFNYIQSIPGIYAIQRPFFPSQDYNNAHGVMQTTGMVNVVEDKQQMIGFKRQIFEQFDDLPSKSLCLGYTTPHINVSSGGLPMWSIPPLLPSVPSNIGMFFSKIPPTPVPHCGTDVFDQDNIFLDNLKSLNCDHKLKSGECVSTLDEFSANLDVKVEMGGVRQERAREEPLNQVLRLEDGMIGLGFEPQRGSERCCKS